MNLQRQTEISDILFECDELFTRYVCQNRPRGAAIEASQQRFWTWLQAFNSVSNEHLPLNPQLGEEQVSHTRQLVLLLLGVLKQNLSLALHHVQHSATNPTRPCDSPDTWDIALFGIEGSLKRLEKVVSTIHGAATASLERRTIAYAGKSRNRTFERHVARVLQYGFRSVIPPGLGRLLFASFLHRHYRILQERMMPQEHKPRRKTPPESVPESNTPQDVVSAQDIIPQAHAYGLQPSVGVSVELYRSQITDGDDQEDPSGLFRAALKQDLTVSSACKTGIVQHLEAPAISAGQTDAMCPICWERNNAEEFRGQKWRQVDQSSNVCHALTNDFRAHVDQDLQPYVCISQHCSKNLLFFADRRSWIRHMRQVHTTLWIRHLHNDVAWKCTLPHPQNTLYRYSTEEGLFKHMKSGHEGLQEDREEIRRLASTCEVPVPRPLNICPICGEDHSRTGHWEDHDSDHDSDFGSSNTEGGFENPALQLNLPQDQSKEMATPARSSADLAVTQETLDHQRTERYIGKHLKALAYYFCHHLFESSNIKETWSQDKDDVDSIPEFWDPPTLPLGEIPDPLKSSEEPDDELQPEEGPSEANDRLRKGEATPLIRWAQENPKEGPWFLDKSAPSTTETWNALRHLNNI